MSQNQKTIAENRKARHEYELYDRFEAGLVLQRDLQLLFEDFREQKLKVFEEEKFN